MKYSIIQIFWTEMKLIEWLKKRQYKESLKTLVPKEYFLSNDLLFKTLTKLSTEYLDKIINNYYKVIYEYA